MLRWVFGALRLKLTGPQYTAGTLVENRWAAPWSVPEELVEYLGPHFGYELIDAPGPSRWRHIVNELWRCKSGSEVAVGYFWRPVAS